jgi:hypothetical protein
MRNVIFTAATVAALVLGSASAFAIGGGNIAPEASPYALLAPQTLGAPELGGRLNEGRSAFVGEQAAPAVVAPWAVQTPEDSTYYSRGR